MRSREKKKKRMEKRTRPASIRNPKCIVKQRDTYGGGGPVRFKEGEVGKSRKRGEKT